MLCLNIVSFRMGVDAWVTANVAAFCIVDDVVVVLDNNFLC